MAAVAASLGPGFSGTDANPHEGRAGGVGHDAADVGKVHVDQSGLDDNFGDAHDSLSRS